MQLWRPFGVLVLGDYSELHRPQFHFTARENWLNDPNGLVYHDGVWHLFFQHNIEAPTWGKMWWGHAVSDDLLHWSQVENALDPDDTGSMFSGSAVVDHENTAGFGKDALLIFYTAAGMHADPARPFTQCLAYSVDGGRNWTKHENNPIVDWMEADNRDPKVVWHRATRQWIMALYLGHDGYCLMSSPDALNWTRIQDLSLEGDSECPDFFPLLDESGKERWIFAGASGSYRVGRFDGHVFTPETPLRHYESGTNGYAGQTWSDAPDDRRIQISWMAGGRYPEMPFNQQLSVPVELSLLGSGADAVLVRWPVRELATLRVKTVKVDQQAVSNGRPFIAETDASLMDVSFRIQKRDATALYIMIRGHAAVFDWVSNKLTIESSGKSKMVGDRSAASLPDEPELSVRILVDRASIEVFINDGRISAAYCFLPDGYVAPLVLHTYSGDQIIEDFELHELSSVWAN